MRNFENKEKIVQVSGGLSVVSFVMLLFLGSGIVTWLFQLINQIILPAQHGITWLPNSQLVNFVLAFVMEFMVWWNFWSFFSRLKAGHLFDTLTVKRLMSAGRWKIAIWFYSIILMEVENKFATHPLGEMLDGLFVGFWIVFVAWLLREGQTLEEEQKLTV
jgi:hypothetical protein